MQVEKSVILEYLSSLKDELKQKGITKIGLFGSFATNSQNIYSDIDIAIKKDKAILEKNSVYYYFELINFLKSKIKNKFNRNVDIFDLDSNSNLKQNIEKELLYV